ncbi:MAG: type II/IV secretion system protein [Lentisphaerae bacterium]|nr:type II/IV secretion system protein [Lentisphaerota bacterium]
MIDQETQALYDILLEAGAAPEQLQEALEERERNGKNFRDVVLDYGFCNEEELLHLIADNLGAEVIDLLEIDIPTATLDTVDPETARTYGVVAVRIENDLLHLAMRNPLDTSAVDDLRFILGRDFQIVMAPEDQFDEAIEKYYPFNAQDMVSMFGDLAKQESEYENEDELESAANSAPVVRFVDFVIRQAIKDKASDIHFEPFEHEFRIRYRVDGALYELPPPPKIMALPITSRVKILSGLNISERRVPQDGRIQTKMNGKPIDLRVSCLPTSYGESVVLRVLDRTVVNLSLDSLGLDDALLNKFREIIHLPNGILLVTGPTGSGKTTTLYSAINEINVVGDKILTAEDPVEYDIDGIVQVPINEAVGMTFEKALRAFLRQDPDRILVGEIRDFTTAQIAVEASLTGHFVFSTLHTNDSASTVTRLVDMGLEPFLICSSLVGVLSQRLLRRVCYACKTPYTPSDEELERLELTREDIGNRPFYYGKGCQICKNTGYKGRKAICELMVMNPELSNLIYRGAPTLEIQNKAIAMGMRTMREDGLLSIYNGETSVDEVLRYT